MAYEGLCKSLYQYHKDNEKFSAYFNFKGMPAVITDSRRIVFFEYQDLLTWTENNNRRFSELADHAERTGYSAWELVSLGGLTPLSTQGLQQLGFQVQADFLSRNSE